MPLAFAMPMCRPSASRWEAALYRMKAEVDDMLSLVQREPTKANKRLAHVLVDKVIQWHKDQNIPAPTQIAEKSAATTGSVTNTPERPANIIVLMIAPGSDADWQS